MKYVSEELKRVRGVIIRFALVFLLFFISLLVLAPQPMATGGIPLTMATQGRPSLAMELFLLAKGNLIPDGIPVVALGPVAPFVAPIVMAFLIALLLSFPFGLFGIARFLRPALRPEERGVLSSILLPSLFLFYLGCGLAYFLIIPKTFSVLYSFAEPMDVLPFFALDDFISSVFFLTVSVGIAFLLPVFMVGASRMGIFPKRFWFQHWRGALVSAIIFSAIITPDGSGVTMMLLSLPLFFLYLIGAIVAEYPKRSREPVI